MFDHSSLFTRKQLVVLTGGVVCLAALLVSLVRSDSGSGALPRIVDRVVPPKSEPKLKLQPQRPVDSKRTAPPEAGSRAYLAKTQLEFEGWKKAGDPKIPVTDVFVSSELRIIEPKVRELPSGTVIVSGTTSITVEGSFTLADDILSVPPLAYFELVTFTPQGTKTVFHVVPVHDLEVEGKTYKVRSTVLETRQAGEYYAILNTCGRDLAKVKVRFE